MKSSEEYLIHLLRCVLLNEKPPEKPEDFSFEELYRAAAVHNIDSMAFYGVDRLEHKPDEALYKKWKQKKDQCMVLSLNQLHQRDVLIKTFTDNNIRVLPLKGCLMKEMYPKPEYRQMADLDMLIMRQNAEKARDIMLSMGYSVREFDNESVDEYSKPPFMNVELHSRMVAKEYKYTGYYDDIWEKAVAECDESGRPTGCYHLEWSDYYIYLLVHLAKHFEKCGTGIRSFMDIYVFLKAHGSDIDNEYINRELEKLDLCDFRKSAERLTDIWFGGGEYDDYMREMEEYVFSSGAYGTFENRVKNHINNMKSGDESLEKAKVRYFFSRIFLKYEFMCTHYKVLRKFPFLLPFCWIHRFFHAVFCKNKEVRAEMKNMKSMK